LYNWKFLLVWNPMIFISSLEIWGILYYCIIFTWNFQMLSTALERKWIIICVTIHTYILHCSTLIIIKEIEHGLVTLAQACPVYQDKSRVMLFRGTLFPWRPAYSTLVVCWQFGLNIDFKAQLSSDHESPVGQFSSTGRQITQIYR